ncbi:hypothetical protein BSMD_026300 [Bacillus subtilis Miyagi-4]|nr:hypothetical protein BSMD_026300 [Bacillus subtilis Miyagi-4]
MAAQTDASLSLTVDSPRSWRGFCFCFCFCLLCRLAFLDILDSGSSSASILSLWLISSSNVSFLSSVMSATPIKKIRRNTIQQENKTLI